MLLQKMVRWLSDQIVNGPFARILRNPILAAISPPLLGGYFLLLDVFGTELWWIKDYRWLHLGLFGGAIVCEVIFRGLLAWGNWLDRRVEKTGETLRELIHSVSKIIFSKTQRFRNQLRLLEKPSASPFELITRPIDQIGEIFKESRDFFRRIDIDPEACDGTVMHLDPDSQQWKFLVVAQSNWERAAPDEIMQSESAAKLAWRTGNEQFFPSKSEAAKVDKYFMSDRDRHFGERGSIYCKPIKVELPTYTESFVVTFSTYGSEVCDAGDRDAEAAAKLLFSEFARRIELELILFSIKEFKRRTSRARQQKMRKSRKK